MVICLFGVARIPCPRQKGGPSMVRAQAASSCLAVHYAPGLVCSPPDSRAAGACTWRGLLCWPTCSLYVAIVGPGFGASPCGGQRQLQPPFPHLNIENISQNRFSNISNKCTNNMQNNTAFSHQCHLALRSSAAQWPCICPQHMRSANPVHATGALPSPSVSAGA